MWEIGTPDLEWEVSWAMGQPLTPWNEVKCDPLVIDAARGFDSCLNK